MDIINSEWNLQFDEMQFQPPPPSTAPANIKVNKQRGFFVVVCWCDISELGGLTDGWKEEKNERWVTSIFVRWRIKLNFTRTHGLIMVVLVQQHTEPACYFHCSDNHQQSHHTRTIFPCIFSEPHWARDEGTSTRLQRRNITSRIQCNIERGWWWWKLKTRARKCESSNREKLSKWQ